jgi:copper chaperone NosL
MTYQPPLLGSKQLLNFTATSLPASGGWIAIGSFLAGLAVFLFDWQRSRRLAGRRAPVLRTATSVLMLSAVLMLSGCSASEPVPINYGEDACDYCRMTIVEQGFGSEFVTTTGKAYRFDSIECLAAYLMTRPEPGEEQGVAWVSNFAGSHEFLAVEAASFVHAPAERSPMGLSLFAFGDPGQAKAFSADKAGTVVAWPELTEIVRAAWLDRNSTGDSTQ